MIKYLFVSNLKLRVGCAQKLIVYEKVCQTEIEV